MWDGTALLCLLLSAWEAVGWVWGGDCRWGLNKHSTVRCCDWSFSDGEKERAMRSERPRLG